MRSLKIILTCVVLSLTLMAGKCDPKTVAANICPTLVEYTQAEKQQLADELEEITRAGKYPMLRRVVIDNKITRNDIRHCLSLVKR